MHPMAGFAGHVSGPIRYRSMRTLVYQPFSYDQNTLSDNLHTTLHHHHFNPSDFTNDLVAQSHTDDEHSHLSHRGAGSGLRSN